MRAFEKDRDRDAGKENNDPNNGLCSTVVYGTIRIRLADDYGLWMVDVTR
jgi:hypothetical protein